MKRSCCRSDCRWLRCAAARRLRQGERQGSGRGRSRRRRCRSTTSRADRSIVIVTADAVLYPFNQANVTSKISAPVRRVLVNRGDHVKAGQLLAELESRDLAAAARGEQEPARSGAGRLSDHVRRHGAGRPDQSAGRCSGRAAGARRGEEALRQPRRTAEAGRAGAEAGGRCEGRDGAGAEPARYGAAASANRCSR